MAAFHRRLADLARSLAAVACYEAAVAVIALRCGSSDAELRRRCQRKPALVMQRRQALYLAVMRGHSRRRIAKVTGLSPEIVARACRLVEDARDDPELDRVLDELELEVTG